MELESVLNKIMHRSGSLNYLIIIL